MKYKVKITRLPQARTGYQVQGALANDISDFSGNGSSLGKPNQQVRKSMGGVPRDEANLEAEGGETLVGDIDGSTFPSFFNIKGPRHSSGGVPMSLPDDTFIFSDTKAMKIIDPQILKMFGKSPKKGGYTPAELSKVYDINKYRKLLQDPDSSKVEQKTAEMMIKNYVIKLGALAIAQESKKGFPQGIPVIAKPYMEANNIKEEDLIPENARQKQDQMSQQEEEPTEMPSGQPIAMPEEQQSMQEPPMNQEDTMQYGGMRRLRRAQEGMQQPSPEQMAMMQQQQQGQQQEQGGDQMQQLIQQVTQALDQGAKPEEVVAELLQGEIPPEEIAQIFVELGMPENEVEQLIMGVIQQMQGGQQQQMDPRQQQQPISEEEMMAMQQQDPRQMQQSPMAKYGMVMGGFGMPLILENGGSSFYGMQNPMNYGSSKLNMFTDNDLYTAKNGVELNKFEGEGNSQVNTDGTPKTKEQLETELRNKDKPVTVIKTKKLPDGTVEITRSDGTKVYAKGDSGGDIIYQKDPEKRKKGTGTVDPAQYKIDICSRMKNQGYTAEQAAGAGWIHSSQIANFKNCENLKRTGEDKSEFYELEQDCPCKDDKGVEIPGVFATKDDAGNCLPETCYEEVQKCYCIDPETGQEVEVQLTDGKCDCESQGLEQGSYQGQNQGGYGFPEWTTQDKLNLGTALATQTGIEYPTAMTYQAPEVELAKQEWLAGNQALTGQGAKNLDIIARSTAPSNVKQASAASLQGDIAERVVNNIAGVQARNVGTENQERGMNYQGRTAAGQNRQNILNQYMDKVGATENNYRGEMNAKRALTTQMANTGIKNAADIYNLQTEQYRIDPRTGMQIFKGGKPIKPEASEADDIAYIQSLQKAGIKDDQIELLLKKRLSKFGGAIFRHGGMVYGNSTYPFYND
jgi:hypothetical protein